MRHSVAGARVVAAESVLQFSLLAQHRFAEALVFATAARDAEPDNGHQGVSIVDHRRRASTVERKIREELDARQDIYAYDLLTWSLHRRGRNRESAVSMARALQQQIQDAQLFYHAGMIYHALGDATAARDMLERALAVNPSFHPTQPALARATLASLEVPRDAPSTQTIAFGVVAP